MPTEMELTLEQTQQGVSYEVSNIRVNSFTMKMEILLEPTSNKLMVEHAEYDESNTYVLERFNTSAGNPVKKILLKLNLSDHRSILTDPMVSPTEPGRMTKPYSSPCFIANCFMQAMKNGGGDFRYSDTTHLSRSVNVLKLKNFKKDATLKLFKNGMSMSVQKSQVHKMAKFIRWRRDCAWLMISRGSRSLCQIQVQGTSSIQEVNDHYNIFTRERQEYELRRYSDTHIFLEVSKVLKLKNFKERCNVKAFQECYDIVGSKSRKSTRWQLQEA
ncbi:hypothetical protein Tco_0826265 [Tanacetum coccineum]